MTISSTIATATLRWTGVETGFSPGMQAMSVTDMALVYTVDGGSPLTLVLNTHYTAALDGNRFFTAAPLAMPAASGNLVFVRSSTYLQTLSLLDGVQPGMQALMDAFDLETLRAQEIRRDISVSTFSGFLTAWLASLPTTPGASGTWWNDGGIPAYVT